MIRLILLFLFLFSSCSTLTHVKNVDKDKAKNTRFVHVIFLPRNQIVFTNYRPEFSTDSSNWGINETVYSAIEDSLRTKQIELKSYRIVKTVEEVTSNVRKLDEYNALLLLTENEIQMNNGMLFPGMGFLQNTKNLVQTQIEPYAMLAAFLFFPHDKLPAEAYNSRFVGGSTGVHVSGVQYRKQFADFTAPEVDILKSALKKQIRTVVNALCTDLGLSLQLKE